MFIKISNVYKFRQLDLAVSGKLYGLYQLTVFVNISRKANKIHHGSNS